MPAQIQPRRAATSSTGDASGLKGGFRKEKRWPYDTFKAGSLRRLGAVREEKAQNKPHDEKKESQFHEEAEYVHGLTPM